MLYVTEFPLTHRGHFDIGKRHVRRAEDLKRKYNAGYHAVGWRYALWRRRWKASARAESRRYNIKRFIDRKQWWWWREGKKHQKETMNSMHRQHLRRSWQSSLKLFYNHRSCIIIGYKESKREGKADNARLFARNRSAMHETKPARQEAQKIEGMLRPYWNAKFLHQRRDGDMLFYDWFRVREHVWARVLRRCPRPPVDQSESVCDEKANQREIKSDADDARRAWQSMAISSKASTSLKAEQNNRRRQPWKSSISLSLFENAVVLKRHRRPMLENHLLVKRRAMESTTWLDFWESWCLTRSARNARIIALRWGILHRKVNAHELMAAAAQEKSVVRRPSKTMRREQ